MVVIDGVDRGLGYVHAPDDRHHLMASQLLEAVALVNRYYRTGPVLDQGQTNSCVGFTCRQWMQTAPVMYKQAMPGGLEIYRYALTVDEFHGEQDTGTSLQAGLKSLQHFGRVASYVWASSADDVRQWIVGNKGSVIVGTHFTENMANPTDTPNGRVMIPTGRVVGGHAYLLMGYSINRDAFRVTNSWSRMWAESGRAWLRFGDFRDLLSARGDAVGVIEATL